MPGDRTGGNGQTQAITAVCRLSRQAHKRLTELIQPLLWHSRSLIFDADCPGILRGLDANLNLASLRAEALGIAQQVIEGAGQLLGPTI